MSALEDRRWLVLTFVCLVLSVDLPMILFHTYVKLKFEKRVSADDLVIALADVSGPAHLHGHVVLMRLTRPQLLWIGYIICQVAACMNGFGAHAADLSKEFHYINSSSARNGDLVEALRVRPSQRSLGMHQYRPHSAYPLYYLLHVTRSYPFITPANLSPSSGT